MAEGRSKELAVNTGLFAVGLFGSRFISFLLLPLYTTVLSTGDYGIVDLMSSIVSLLVPLLTLNIQDAVLRFGLENDGRPEEILSVGLRIVGGSACFLLAVLAVVYSIGLVPVDEVYLIFLFAMYLLSSLSNVITMYVKSQNHVHPLVVSGIGNTLVMSASAIVLLVVVKAGIIGYMASILLGSLFTVVYLTFAGKVWHGVTVSIRLELLKSMTAFSIPLVANSLAWWINDMSDRWVVTLICGAAANGVYAVAYKIPAILAALQTVFYDAWAITAVKEFDSEDRDGFLGRTYELYSGAISICCSCIMVVNVPLAAFLYSNEFFEAWRYVPLLLVGVLLNGLALFEGCLFTAAKNTKAISSTTIAGAAVNIGFCIALTLALGPIGAAVATLMGYLVTWGARTRIMLRKIAQLRVAWKTEVITLAVLIMQAIVAMQIEMQILQLPLVVLVLFLRRGQLGSVWGLIKKKIGLGS